MTKRKSKEFTEDTKIKSLNKFQIERSRPPIIAQSNNQKLHQDLELVTLGSDKNLELLQYN